MAGSVRPEQPLSAAEVLTDQGCPLCGLACKLPIICQRHGSGGKPGKAHPLMVLQIPIPPVNRPSLSEHEASPIRDSLADHVARGSLQILIQPVIDHRHPNSLAAGWNGRHTESSRAPFTLAVCCQ